MITIKLTIEGLNVSGAYVGGGGEEYTIEIPNKSYRLHVIDLYKDTLHLLTRLVREGTFHREEHINDFKILGENLYSILLGHQDNELGKILEKLIYEDNKEVNLQLAFEEDSEFIGWPWELIYHKRDEKNGEFLLDKGNVFFYRSLKKPFEKKVNEVANKEIKILFVAFGPHSKIRLRDPRDDASAEELEKNNLACLQYANIRKYLLELRDTSYKGTGIKFRVESLTEEDLNEKLLQEGYVEEEINYQVTLDKVSEKLVQFNPDILHIVAHGYCSENGGEIACVTGREIRWEKESNLFKAYKESQVREPGRLRMVFFQTCESALPGNFKRGSGLALNAFKDDIHSVVAMQSKISQELACNFSIAFYQKLFDQHNKSNKIISAFKAARQEIGKRAFFGIPVLYTRTGQEWDASIVTPGNSTIQAGKVKCIWCGEENEEGYNFCGECGKSIRCKSCKKQLPAEFTSFHDKTHCPFCGKEDTIISQ
ncbi:CHAT domain-containing protein [Pseudoflavitalea sp. X16]|uniref:CHAT domain-containing protein n=1 Tax=Paraflavitalea devenefica TaxID=2716334 RepID=UPI00141DEBD9|nr:CHAT domain-containing protein [Paraflavitalea devenefica]NII24791.1 CHAT domain-containing protein [Paraflavitalea devenefica]